MEFTIHHQVLGLVFGISLLMGAVANKTHFCTMGAVSDWVNMGDTGRMGAWVFAMAVAVLGVGALEAGGLIALAGDTFPPYRTPHFAGLRYVLGGILFGIGMTLAGGCSNKILVRLGGGDLKSALVLVVAAFCAFMMMWGEDPFNPGEGFFSNYFLSWIAPTTVDLGQFGLTGQSPTQWSGGVFVALVAGLALLGFALAQHSFRRSLDNWLGGGVVGLAVVSGWWITAGSLGNEWLEWADFADTRPARVAQQSYTFVSPMGDAWRYLRSPETALISFGMVAMVGVVAGSLGYAVLSGQFRWAWFVSTRDLARSIAGGVLIGVGGVLAMGCTIGQGISGVSTLALGSFLALGGILLGSAVTMKVQYYRMVYEKEASFGAALVSALADLRLLPQSLRKLDAV